MTIGIIGSGNVGGTLGTRWAQGGHQVIFGTRNAAAADIRELLAKAGASARAASQKEAAQAAEVVLVSTPWPVTRDVVQSLGDLAGKVVIDAVNPLLANLTGLDLANTTSAAEQVASWAPGAKVVKAFNTVGFNIMANPAFGADRPVLFYCGDDAGAKKTVRSLIEPLGFDPVDAGPLTQARLLEPFALLWISLALQYGQGRNIAFKLLHR